ncbi:MAG: Ku protein [Gammaproteobacteria bacterium]|nr:Ku protein [Gammaproteobacteria bacterium]
MARAMWKGILTIGEERVAVKLFAAVEDRTVRFRLLHDEDGVPVKQRLVEPESEEIVEYAETERAFLTPERDLVVLHRDELEALEPAPSREIEVLRFVPKAAVDERWYERPYYLGPDGDASELAALAAAMRETERIGIARWVMRKKEYRGALRVADDGVPMLIMLRSADEVIVASELGAPTGKALDEREIAMAQQLLSLLESRFEPTQYRDEYRERMLELIRAKAEGKVIRHKAARPLRVEPDLAKALRESLEAERKRA